MTWQIITENCLKKMKIITLNKSIFGCLILVSLLLTSCGVNSNLMFKIPRNSESKSDSTQQKEDKYYKIVTSDSIPKFKREDYRISYDDKITFKMSTNEGQRIVEGLSGVGSESQSGNSSNEYTVRSDGFVYLPVLGDVNLVGLTIKQSEDTLAKMYGKHYLNPFIQLRVTNQRVIVMPGAGGDAQVVTLKNTNTTIMEVIAEAGGISQRGKAKSIKLMRLVNGKREIYPIDLSTIDGLVYADMIVQANDYIYIEPNPRLGREALAEFTPYIAILSSFTIVLTLINNFK